VLSSHFYTLSETERDVLFRDHQYAWTYEGVTFLAYPEGRQPANTCPVYRFRSGAPSRHLYTISERERNDLVANSPDVWTAEGVAFYVYPPRWDSREALTILRDSRK